jgi:hypothetical protein
MAIDVGSGRKVSMASLKSRVLVLAAAAALVAAALTSHKGSGPMMRRTC